MKNDPTHRERQVWQRVNRQEAPSRESLRPWLLSALEAAADYRHLAQNSSGRRREILVRLAEGEEAAAACLRGMLAVSGSKVSPSPPAPNKRPKVLLYRLRQCRESYRFYSGCAADPEYGAVFQRLALRQGEQMALLLTLLGEP